MAYVMKNNAYHCGGSIITHSYILTAAHCLDTALMVRLGEYDDRTDPDCEGIVSIPRHEDYGIEVALYHRQYDNVTQNNGIALLRLGRNIIFQSHIHSICLRLRDFQIFAWGRTNRCGATTHVLQTTNLRHYNNSHCENQFRTLTRNQICAGSEEWDLYNGVFGSPLVTKIITWDGLDQFVQMGIASTGHIFSGVYTNVPNYEIWIQDSMRTLDLQFK